MKHEHIVELGTEKIDVLISMMAVLGLSFAECADKIQKDWGLWADVSQDAAKKRLQRYYHDVVAPNLMKTVAIKGGSGVSEMIVTEYEKPQMSVNAYSTLESLIVVQMRRLTKVLGNEDKLPTVMESVRREIELLGKLTKDLMQMQLELGLQKRVPKEFMIHSDSDALMIAANQFGEFMKDERGERVSLLVVDKLKELMGNLAMLPEVKSMHVGETIDGEVVH